MTPTDLASPPRVLLVLPQDEGAGALEGYLKERGFEVLRVHEGAAGYDVLDREPVDVLISYLQTARIDGMRLIQLARQRNAEICSIILASSDEIELGTEAMRQGAYDFQVRPVNLTKIGAVLDRGLSYQRLVGEVQAEQVASSRATVLLVGETGTGKGEVAKAIHQLSPRRNRPFVETNCGALPDSIVESELFGHERGAFTGASTSRKGRFELADEGTLFLDEVGDLSGATQVKLLRVIQSGEFERVGGTQTQRVDSRLLAATNRDLEQMVEEGSYRQDLFYRLNVVTIKIPPLRECGDDIPLLVNEFLREFCLENDKELRMRSEVMDLLTDYKWPGNVRELKNCLEGMVVMAKNGAELSEADIPSPIRQAPRRAGSGGINAGMTMREIEKEAIVATLKAVDFDRRKAAKMLEIGLSTLYRKEKEYGLRLQNTA